MLTIKLDGGLGNQLFQYAFIKSASRYYDEPFRVDISTYAESTARGRFRLNQLNISSALFESQKRLTRNIHVLRLLKKAGVSEIGRLRIETELNYVPFDRSDPGTYYYGYYQFYKYSADIYPELVTECCFQSAADSSYYRQITFSESVGVHVRRGDYMGAKVSKIMAELDGYYTLAAQTIAERVGTAPVFFLFTDDPGWVRANLLPGLEAISKTVIVDHRPNSNSDLLDFECMKACRHQIIANSTFSWWAAYLNVKPGKIVIAPKAWYRKRNLDIANFYPKDWILLES